ncbi:jerky protein-like [Belonocnema kinseyi]|uniref:jerky protein-like n=1 Tax=Belonocnema kinseyi TaxID=2817044 RepID=UPI00143D402D|nr:jerky protein-like [Belonocnema kinseyi]XP_033230367.1 jerky protein-like [Belonocnema kinseyi]
MEPPTKKRKKSEWLTAGTKSNILKAIHAGDSVKNIAEKYNVHASTVRKWRKNEEDIAEKKTKNPNKKQFKQNPNERLNEALHIWLLERRKAGFSVSGPQLKEKARELAKIVGSTENFVASDGWLTYWKKTYGIRHLAVTGEKLSDDLIEIEEFQDTKGFYTILTVETHQTENSSENDVDSKEDVAKVLKQDAFKGLMDVMNYCKEQKSTEALALLETVKKKLFDRIQFLLCKKMAVV